MLLREACNLKCMICLFLGFSIEYFSDSGRPQVTETAESETTDKGGLLYISSSYCTPAPVEIYKDYFSVNSDCYFITPSVSFIHSFSKHLMSVSCVPGTELDSWESKMNLIQSLPHVNSFWLEK